MTVECLPPRELQVEDVQLARVYADAVWKLAVQQGDADAFVAEFESLVRDVLDRQPAILNLFEVGSLSREHRTDLIDRVFGGRASELLVNFLRTLNQHDRLSALRAVGSRLRELWDRHRGRTRVLLRSAQPLADDQLDAVLAMLRERFRIEPELATEVDPDILGGMCIRIGDTVYDRSVRWNLKQLRENILTRSAHEIQSG